jgi:superfamily II DNA/RNA helicase
LVGAAFLRALVSHRAKFLRKYSMSFEALGLHVNLIRALTDSGYTKPTPVQEQAVPAAINGRDLMVSSQTGSGKTAAFMLPALHKLISAEVVTYQQQNTQSGTSIRPLTWRPSSFRRSKTKNAGTDSNTRTRVASHNRNRQIQRLFTPYQSRIDSGWHALPKQMQLLSRNPEILVATPGRLIDHMDSGKIDFSELQMLVLDEADRMLDMGFIDDIEKIVAATPATRQTMLFSATLDGVVGNMAKRITTDPMVIQIAALPANMKTSSKKFTSWMICPIKIVCSTICCATNPWIRP